MKTRIDISQSRINESTFDSIVEHGIKYMLEFTKQANGSIRKRWYLWHDPIVPVKVETIPAS